jgi:hypothetical protein
MSLARAVERRAVGAVSLVGRQIEMLLERNLSWRVSAIVFLLLNP